MPTVQSGSKILVTGANGYIALWVVKSLLEKGYSVRGTVRSAAKGDELTKLFASYDDKLEVVIVSDITKEGAFDEAVKGIDAIEHVASPVHVAPEGSDPNVEYIIPAVKGTIGIFQSALKYGPQIKRIVLTSSIAAVFDPTALTATPPTVFSEKHWGRASVEEVKNFPGNKSTSMQAYYVSKTLAEQGAWDFYNENKSKVSWDVVALCPSFVLGPILHEVKKPGDLGSSLAMWFRHVLNDHSEEVLKSSYSFVDIRDLADAHVLSLENERVAGERLIINSGEQTWQETRNILYARNPTHFDSGAIPRGNSTLKYALQAIFSNNKSIEILGITYKNHDDTFVDTLEIHESRGWLKK